MNINARVPVGVLGASGYVGQELLRLLAGHPGATVAFATAESAAGERRDGIALVRIEDAPLARAEVVLSALPHGVSARHVQEARGLGKRAVDLSADFRLYADEPCVAVLHGALPSLKDVVYRNRVAIGVAAVANVRRPRLTVIAAIDNLVKGAAGQAIQNMNVMLGLPETAGLTC